MIDLGTICIGDQACDQEQTCGWNAEPEASATTHHRLRLSLRTVRSALIIAIADQKNRRASSPALALAFLFLFCLLALRLCGAAGSVSLG